MSDQCSQSKEEIITWIEFAIGLLREDSPEVARSYLENVKRIIADG